MHTWQTSACLVLVVSAAVSAETLNVPQDYPSIQAAIDVASPGDVVLVSPGNYLEAIDFLGKNITVESVGGPIDTGIKPPIGTDSPTVTFASKESPTAVLSGFSIGGGFGGPHNDPIFGACFAGGGIYCVDSSPRIVNCRIVSNNGSPSSDVIGHGGGMLVLRGNPTLIGCEFRQNTSTGHGGAVYILDNSQPTFDACLFQDNEAAWGGAITCTVSSSPTFTACQFIGNQAYNVGGGLYIRSSSSPTVDRCEFSENIQAGNPNAGGAGVTIYGSGNGGGPCNPIFTSCDFFNNTADGYGGAMHAAYSGNATIVDCQFLGNTAIAGGGAIAAVGNDEVPTTVNVSGSLIDSNRTDGNGGGIDSRTSTIVIDDSVVTLNEAGSSGGGCSFQSSEGSSIAQSTLCGNTPEQTSGLFQDLGGNMISETCDACSADFNSDGVVDGADFGTLLAVWGTCPGCSEDLTGDGAIDGADVGLFLSMWGVCP